MKSISSVEWFPINIFLDTERILYIDYPAKQGNHYWVNTVRVLDQLDEEIHMKRPRLQKRKKLSFNRVMHLQRWFYGEKSASIQNNLRTIVRNNCA